MTKNYFYTIFFFLLFSLTVSAQDNRTLSDGLGFYPNPVSNGKIYITSKTTQDKDIAIFDVLGKKVFQITTGSREININSIPPGVYIIKIIEGETTATRKLIVR